MNYRHLGRCGLKVSELSFGSWVTYGNQVDLAAARELMAAAYDAGVNFFDNAEVYAHGRSEEIMGAVLAELGWPRIRYAVSTKFYWGFRTGVNDDNTLNRKYLLAAIDGSLARLRLDFVDLVYCHRPDPTTPIEETVWRLCWRDQPVGRTGNSSRADRARYQLRPHHRGGRASRALAGSRAADGRSARRLSGVLRARR